jgi:fructose-1,6-bisphosphatase/inositol monophosphatase family enzyme
MMLAMDLEAVADAIREVAATELMPRFADLSTVDVSEKRPGEVVTDADHAAELALIERLQAIRDLPVVGEEATSADPSLLDLAGSARAVWLVDPLDGTSNFVDGSTDFGVLVALVERGTAVASWCWHPAEQTMTHAVRGGGAWVDGRLAAADAPDDPDRLAGVLMRRYLPADVEARIDRRLVERASTGRRCAALDYPDLVRGATDYLVYWRTLPWDHAPGVLLAEEAGLRAGRPDGSRYRPADHDTRGLVVAHPEIWHKVRDAVFG